MLMPEAWRALIDAGVDLVPIDARHVELRQGRHRQQMLLQASSRPLNPSDVLALVERHPEPGLLVLPVATAEVRHTAEQAGWSWLVMGPGGVRGVVRLGDKPVEIGEPNVEKNSAAQRRPGRVPWGSLTLVRRLLEQPAATQKVLATLAHVSQPRASQTLSALVDQQLVARHDAGWVVRDFDRLLRLWLDTYPGPGGISTYWYGLDSPRDQAQAVIRLLARRSSAEPAPAREQHASWVEPSAVLSGDVAADIVAPWRTPGRAVVYAHRGADLSEAGLTPVGVQEATLELIVPQDPGVWPLPSPNALRGTTDSHESEPVMGGKSPMPIADPLQILWDVQRAPGSDSGEAAARLWQVLREHSRVIQAAATS
jgi:hypothetical protein